MLWKSYILTHFSWAQNTPQLWRERNSQSVGANETMYSVLTQCSYSSPLLVSETRMLHRPTEVRFASN